MEINKTKDEIFLVLDKAIESQTNSRNRYSGMTYQEGIIHALDWILGRADDPPLKGLGRPDEA
jgi:hypothetical protein